MPSGFTSKLYDGDQSFEEFVWRCARGMDALVSMREDSLDAPVPERLPVENRYEVDLARSNEELLKWSSLGEPERRELYEARRAAVEAEAARDRGRAQATRGRYSAMLARVNAWDPPTPDHAGLKRLMIEQLEQSLQMDCDPYNPSPFPEFSEWEEKHELSLVARIDRLREDVVKEKKRNAERQKWVDDLRASVPRP